MGSGGVSGGQLTNAAGGTADLSKVGTQNQAQQYGLFRQLQSRVNPFYQSRMENGMPGYRNLTDFDSGTTAQAFAPIRADLLRRTGNYANLPSGYRDAMLTNLGAQQGRAFDSTLRQNMMANELAKQQGAAGVATQEQIANNTALGYGGQALGANSMLFGGPRKTGVAGTIGGIVQGGLNSFAQGAGTAV